MPILGLSTLNNRWDTIIDKETFKQDILTYIYINQGSLDYDPSIGTTIPDQIFKIKTDTIKNNIMDQIRGVFSQDPRGTLLNIEATDIDKGWIFTCTVQYLGGTPEEWVFQVNEDRIVYKSNGYFPLNEVKEETTNE